MIAFTLITLLGLAGAAALVLAVRRAVTGYEDETGFHEAPPSTVSMERERAAPVPEPTLAPRPARALPKKSVPTGPATA